MATILKNIQIDWVWSGDTSSIKSFNLAISAIGTGTPTQTIATATVEGSLRSHIFNQLIMDSGVEYYAWVQASYVGKDSAWVNQGGFTAEDDGTGTISSVRTFTSLPTVPYNVGDIWLDTVSIKKCTTAKDDEGSYHEDDWTISSTSNNTIFYSLADNGNVEPDGVQGDTWVNTDDNQIYKHNGTEWLEGSYGGSALSGYLTNETHIVSAATDGTGYSLTGSGGNFVIFDGTTIVSSSSDFSITGGTDNGDNWTKTQNGLTLTIMESTGAFSLSGSSWTSDNEVFSLNALYDSKPISKAFSITKSKAGVAGYDTKIYSLKLSSYVIAKDIDGFFTPGSVTASAKVSDGSADPTAYSGRYKVYFDGEASPSYTSSADEADVVIMLSGSKSSIRFELYLAGGTTTLLDSSTVVVVADGDTGEQGDIGLTGDTGEDAKYVIITGDQTFKYLANTSTPTQANIDITATLIGGLTTYDWEFWNGSAWENLSGTQDAQVYTLAYDNAAWSTSSLRIRCTSDGFHDETTIVKLHDGTLGVDGVDGVDTIVGVLNNESHSVPADSDGVVTSFVGANTTLTIFEGISNDSVNWNYTVNKTNVTCSTPSDSRTQTVTGLSADIGYIDFIATKAGYSTINKRFTIAKSRAGVDGSAGVNSRAVSLELATQAIAYNNVGLSPNPNSSLATATAFNYSGTVYYEFLKNDIQVQNTTSNTYTYVPPISYSNMPEKMVVKIREDANNAPVVAKDTVSIVGLMPGTDGVDGTDGTDSIVPVLSNEAHTVPASSLGNVSDFSGAATTLTIYKGLDDDSSHWTFSTVKTNVTSTDSGTPPNRTQTVTGLTADVGYIDFTASRTGFPSINKRFTISKSREGQSNLLVILSNEAHQLPADVDGNVTSYAGSDTTIKLYEGTTELTYTGEGSGSTIGEWKVNLSSSGITPGVVSDQGNYASTALASAMNHDVATITYTVTGKTKDGHNIFIEKVQSFSKSRIGITGEQGETGPVISLTADKQAFTSTDQAMDAGQADVIFTSVLQNITSSPVFTTNPNVTLTSVSPTVKRLSSANFGNNNFVTVTATADGLFDSVTVVRLDESTAEAGADVTGNNTSNNTDNVGNSTAAALVANTESATQAIIDMASDSIFSIQEKATWRTTWRQLAEVYSKIIDEATARGIVSEPEFVNYINKTSVLYHYLIDSPHAIFGDGGAVNTTITGTEFLDAVVGYHETKTVAENYLASYTDWYELHNVPNDLTALGNLLNPYNDWVAGTTGTQANFIQNGSTDENRVENVYGPFKITEEIWECKPSGNGGADGGWNTVNVPIDPSKTYIFGVYIWKLNNSGTAYLGCNNVEYIDGAAPYTLNTNPYFWSGDLPDDTWHLVLGIVHPAGYTGNDLGFSGVYNVDTGAKAVDGTEFRWVAGETVARHRSYHFYNGDGDGATIWQRMARPFIFESSKFPPLETLTRKIHSITPGADSTYGALNDPGFPMGMDTGSLVISGSGVSKSGNFIEGTSGWIIDGQGNAEFNNAKIRGTLENSHFRSDDGLLQINGSNEANFGKTIMIGTDTSNYVKLSPAELEFFYGGQSYSSVKRIEAGHIGSGHGVTFSPAFKEAPLVILALKELMFYDGVYTTRKQFVQLEPGIVSKTGFTPKAYHKSEISAGSYKTIQLGGDVTWIAVEGGGGAACPCNCNYACTCNCNYACTCNCNYCTCNCAYACTCHCHYACTCNCHY